MMRRLIGSLTVVVAIAAGTAMTVAKGTARPVAGPDRTVAPSTVDPTAPGSADAADAASARSASRADRRAWAMRYGQDRATMPVQPDVAAATAAQRAAALDLLRRTESATDRYGDVAKAKAAGFDLEASLARLARTKPAAYRRLMRGRPGPGGRMPMLHVPNLANALDSAVLDPTRPESLMYERDGTRWQLVGVMYSGRAAFPAAPPTPGGPITRWHYHSIGGRPGGGLMMHVFFDPRDDLARAYATEMAP